MKEYEQKICNIIDNMKAEMRYQCDKVNEQAYKQGHKRGYAEGYEIGKQDGYEDGQKSLVNAYVVGKGEDTLEDIKKAEYDRGLADMLEAVKRMRMMTADELEEVFRLRFIGDIFVNLSPSKIISKYHAFKAQIKELEDAEIKVGDEVIIHDTDGIEVAKALVLSIQGEGYGIISSNETLTWAHKKFVKKTDKHYSQIAEVLETMKGEMK